MLKVNLKIEQKSVWPIFPLFFFFFFGRSFTPPSAFAFLLNTSGVTSIYVCTLMFSERCYGTHVPALLYTGWIEAVGDTLCWQCLWVGTGEDLTVSWAVSLSFTCIRLFMCHLVQQFLYCFLFVFCYCWWCVCSFSQSLSPEQTLCLSRILENSGEIAWLLLIHRWAAKTSLCWLRLVIYQ